MAVDIESIEVITADWRTLSPEIKFIGPDKRKY
jgi:hypothetical protein